MRDEVARDAMPTAALGALLLIEAGLAATGFASSPAR